jgi:hypothetical protein
MTLSNTYRNLSILAMLLAAAFCACSVAGDKLPGLTSAPPHQSGTVLMLQADGGAPPPPLLPPSRPPRTT